MDNQERNNQRIKNVIYIGKIEYGGQIYEGQHPAIIDEETFKKVQEKLAENRMIRRSTKNTDCSGLLTHLLKCKTCATTMFHTYSLKNGKHKYRYYLCSNAQKRGYNSYPNRSINAQAIEDDLITTLRTTLKENKHKSCPHKTEVNALLSPVWDTLFLEEKRRILKTILKEVHCDVTSHKIGFVFNDSNLRLEFDADVKKSRSKTTWRKETEIAREPKLRKTLILAHQLQRLMDEKRIENVAQTSDWMNLSPSRIGHILSLLLLSPVIQHEIICDNGKIIDLIPKYKIRSLTAEFDWHQQADLWHEIKQTTLQK